MSDIAVMQSMADALQEGHAIDRHVISKVLHDAAAELAKARKALDEDAQDYVATSRQLRAENEALRLNVDLWLKTANDRANTIMRLSIENERLLGLLREAQYCLLDPPEGLDEAIDAVLDVTGGNR